MLHCVFAPQALELETTGSFTVTVREGGDESGRCGLPGTPRELAYKVLVTSSPSYLNEQDFIIDWQEIKRYFTESYRDLEKFHSCERIACQSCSDIIEMLGQHRCDALEVTIGSGQRAAGMTARWKREPEPTFDTAPRITQAY